uniref:U1 small nuclear ribonucleoprotein 70 kDa n=1 Tax=Echinococcus canadensis TaxID=519352 RepID=A0A915F0T4_9CEST
MTQFLPPNLLALFAPRDPIPYVPPIEKHKNHRKLPYTGVAQFLGEFEDPSETPASSRIETREERKARKRKEKQEQANYKLERDLALWNPKKLISGTTNAYNTLFVARLNYDTSEHKLRREFEVYGPIKKIFMIKDAATGKPRGYAFIEFEHERDMHAANKDANGRKIDGHRILTDIERGRTRPDWRPRRLGKGLGKSRSGPSDSRRDERRRDEDRDRDRDRERNRDRDRDRRRRSRSREYRDRRRRSHSRERRRSRDRSREHGRRDRYRRDEMSQYGEYGAEIKAEYNGDY